jgi:hypothetical protein
MPSQDGNGGRRGPCFCGIVAAQETIIMNSDQARQRAEKRFQAEKTGAGWSKGDDRI